MTESFPKLFKNSLKNIEIRPGSIIKGKIVSIEKGIVLVDAGLKSESSIPIEQFKNEDNKIEINVGDEIDVELESLEDGFGETLLSREKAKKHESWLILEKSYRESKIVLGTISEKVKGGFTVEVKGIRAFLPGSLVDVRPIKDTSFLEGKVLEFKVIKLDRKRNNIVVSRKAIIESENNIERNQLLKRLKEGIKIKGVVKNLTDYGAFIDLGGVDGLLHITDISWKRIKHPSELIKIGDEIKVKILKFDKERTRVSLGLKQLKDDPWKGITVKYPKGEKFSGKVTNLTDYGCFVEINEGIEGLVHISEMDWTSKNIHPSKMFNIGDLVEVMILDIDEERRRISLGIKQCKYNPWKGFFKKYKKNDKVKGIIKSITDFGIFIGLDGGIDGLVHSSDISWNNDKDKIKSYRKGEEIETIVLQIDPERERISLGIKQLTKDPLDNYLESHEKGDLVSGYVVSFNEKILKLKLEDGVFGYIQINKNSNMKNIQVGDSIKVKFFGIDKKDRSVFLEIEKNTHKSKVTKKIKEKKDFSNQVMVEAFKAAKEEK
ncbi:30S ribosomal protein S1 [Candidatus Riesia sp. GBBU]|nr:30S ribosomal protein S1 [Candidatus Riesia sp. GBBU]